MTFEEKHELIVLGFLNDKTGHSSSDEIEEKFKKELGGGLSPVIESLKERGFIESQKYHPERDVRMETVYTITNAGKNKYLSLKKQTSNDNIKTFVLWVTFGAAIISALYAIIQFHFSGEKTSNPPTSKSEIAPAQPIKPPIQTLKPDTIRVPNKNPSDSLLKK